jgi:hypothetical protein
MISLNPNIFRFTNADLRVQNTIETIVPENQNSAVQESQLIGKIGAIAHLSIPVSPEEKISIQADNRASTKIDIAPSDATTPPMNILMIGWDGVQWHHLKQCYDKKLPNAPNGLPNLAAVSSGRIFRSTTTNGATNTKPGWVQLTTGYKAEFTGVISKTQFQPFAPGLTVFEKAELTFGDDNIGTFLISGKKNPIGADYDKGQPWGLVAPQLDLFWNSRRDNSVVGHRGLEALDNFGGQPFVGLIHFRYPDHAGHRYGENSAQYTKQLVNVDKWLGHIVDKLKELNVLDHTLIYVISDHGFNENGRGHGYAPYSFMATNDPSVIRAGDRMDIAPTILSQLGISLGTVGNAPPVDGFPLNQIPNTNRSTQTHPHVATKDLTSTRNCEDTSCQKRHDDDELIGQISGVRVGLTIPQNENSQSYGAIAIQSSFDILIHPASQRANLQTQGNHDPIFSHSEQTIFSNDNRNIGLLNHQNLGQELSDSWIQSGLNSDNHHGNIASTDPLILGYEHHSMSALSLLNEPTNWEVFQ